MVQLVKYLIAFFLGCLFLAHNPELNTKVISVSNTIKDKVVSLTGKAERMESVKLQNTKDALEDKRKKAKEEANYE